MRRAALLVGLALAGLAVTWLVQPNLIIGLRSPRALAWMAGAGLGCAAVGLVAHRLGARPTVALGLAAVPAAVLTAVFVVKPIVDPRELNEAFPVAAASPAALATTAPPVPQATTAAPAPTASPTPQVTSAAPQQTVTTAAKPAAAAPTRVSTGRIRGLDGHAAEGSVSTYRLADGSHVIRFENVDIGGTPDPEVYLLSGSDRTGKSGGTHIGSLKAEQGSFNYVLPKAFVGKDFTVLVWCEQFAVNIAHATQAA